MLGPVGEYAYTGNDGLARVETDFLVRVDGDLSRPRLEVGKHTEFRWLTRTTRSTCSTRHRDVNDGLIRRIAEDGFAALRRDRPLSRRHRYPPRLADLSSLR